MSRAEPISGLNFPANATANSDIRLVWSGANLLPRLTHTAIWKKFRAVTPQTAYEADTWHSRNDGVFHSTADEMGAHGYPTVGTVNGTGQNIGGGQGGTVHYMELAGTPGGADWLASPGGSGVLLNNGQWYTHARSCGPNGSDSRHRVYVDVMNNPSQVIEQAVNTASIPALTAAYYFGCSDWRADQPTTGQNDETPNGIHRGYILFDTELTAAHIIALAALTTNAAVLAYCASNSLTGNLWYLNMNPTPTDVTDKSGAGHNPSWANSNRPALWTG